ncbi:MAG TPA: hypothetical protein VK810_00620 [Dongiaceae bacterium]|jgi:hypothetical protein|nr:hypothetical protein [Dongiaceae bacterium]
MARLKHFTNALATGYIQVGVQFFYTFASIPLALHYLSTQQFGLWLMATTIAGYLLLVDFGMTGSGTRILMDHKDDPASGAYGSVIKISVVVFLIQGTLIAVGGTILSFWLPQLMKISAQFPDPVEAHAASRALFFLSAGQCVIQGFFFPGRIFGNLAIAHQRYDLNNYVQIGALIVQFAALWLAFHAKIGIYSVLVATAAGFLFTFCGSWIVAARFGFFPPRGRWGKFNFKLFKEIFFLGSNVFLMAVGSQLINASQFLIINDKLGLTAATVWAVATKPFIAAQQLVARIVTFSASPMSEMIVRGELERFVKRFRDLVIIYVATAIFAGGCIALCNESFLQVWLKHRDILPGIHVFWSSWDDLLLALWLVVTCVTTMHVGTITYTKKIGRMRYVYFCEGIVFVTVAFLAARHFGISGVIIAAIVANVLCSGVFGIRCTVKYFHIPAREVVIGWLDGPSKYIMLFSLILIGCKFFTEAWPPLSCLAVNAVISAASGLWLLWRVALTAELRRELWSIAARIPDRLKFFGGSGKKSN